MARHHQTESEAEMKYAIVQSSPAANTAREKIAERPNKIYPFEELEVGQSFTVETEQVNWKSLRVVVSQKNKNGKRFVFLKHDDMTPPLCEVARIA